MKRNNREDSDLVIRQGRFTEENIGDEVDITTGPHRGRYRITDVFFGNTLRLRRRQSWPWWVWVLLMLAILAALATFTLVLGAVPVSEGPTTRELEGGCGPDAPMPDAGVDGGL
jgi:hypothetical protein